MPDSNARWIAVYDYFGTGLDQTVYYYLDPSEHDTLINDTTYSTLTGYTYDLPTPSFAGGLYDNGSGQVYYYHPNTARSYLIYDFDVMVGDSVPVWIYDFYVPFDMPPEMMYIAAVDTLDINGSWRKAIGIQSAAAIQNGQGIVHWWLQGIGGTGGLLGTSGALPLDFVGGLECMNASDTVWWSWGPLGTPGDCIGLAIAEQSAVLPVIAIPNPSQGMFNIEGMDVESTTIRDARSQVVLTTTGSVIDLSSYPVGCYFATVVSGNRVANLRLVVAR